MTTFREQLPALADALEGRPPEEILGALAPRFAPGRFALACSFGPEDCLLVHTIAWARLPIDVFTLDTGFLFAETYALWTRLEERTGLTIRAVKADLPALDRSKAPPWEADADGCCAARKVGPLREHLGRLDGWVTGIRRDQTPDRATARVVEWDARFSLVKANPLAAWTSDRVWEELRRLAIPTNALHGQGYLSIGCAPCTSPVKPGEDPRAGRWRGQEKKECGLHADRRPPGPGSADGGGPGESPGGSRP